nr:hypothetical protein [Tanacetum cinerariifolium]
MAPLTFADTHSMIVFLSKSDTSAGLDQIVDFINTQVIQYALMVNPAIYVSCIKQFWAIVSIKKANDVVKLQALTDRKKVVVTEDVIQQDHRLDDVDGVECLPNEEIFVELARMSYEKPPPNAKRTHGTNLVVQWRLLSYALLQERKIGAIVTDKDINLVDIKTQVNLGAELQGRKDDDNVASKVSVAEPTVFDDEEVTMTMAQTLIKMKAKKARLLDEQVAKRLNDEEVEKDAAKEKQEKDDLEKAKGLQQQYDDKHENINWNVVAKQIQGKHLDNIRKYRRLERKPVSIA